MRRAKITKEQTYHPLCIPKIANASPIPYPTPCGGDIRPIGAAGVDEDDKIW